jgi:hypothetical protein
MTEPELDRERIENLVAAILIPVRENMKHGPVSRDRVFESLYALAAAAGLILKSCDDKKAYDFFVKALRACSFNKSEIEEFLNYALVLRCCAKAICRLERNGLKRDAAEIRSELDALGIDVQIMPDPTVKDN